MTKYIRHFGAPLAMSIALAVSACTVKDSKSDTSLATDSALTRDLQIAGRDTGVQPQLRDVPATPPADATPAPAPVTRAPAPAPRPAAPRPKPVATRPAEPTTRTTPSGNTETRNTAGSAASNGGGAVGTIPSGTSLALRSNSRVCTNTFTVGQTFTASVAQAVAGSNGATIPAGADVTLEVTQLKRSENANDKIIMEFAVRSVSFGGKTYPVTGTVADASVERVRNQPKSKDTQKVVGGAVIGAIAGQIFGKSTKSTVIGAAAGAAAGAGAAAATANYEGCVPDGGQISVNLTAPLQVRVSA
ncbi:MAG TPA: hypothetical protein VGP25_20920 [Gemmatimonadaceae bacterium]|jgi:hypothetical protein|nr:hypothetical protein [Gemmatimonadaceae bacterium]